jgi:hypothetical protein
MYNYMTYPFFFNGGEPDWIWRAPRTPNEKYQQFLRNLENVKGSQLYGKRPLNQYNYFKNMGIKPNPSTLNRLASDIDLANAKWHHQRMMDKMNPFGDFIAKNPNRFNNPIEALKALNRNKRFKLGYDSQDLRTFLTPPPPPKPSYLNTKSIMDDVREVSSRTRPVNPKVAAALKYAAEMDAAIKAGKTIDEIPDAPWHKSNQIKPSRWSRFMNSPFIKTIGKAARVIDPFPWMIAPIMHPDQYQYQMPTAMRKGGQIKK